MKNKRSVKFEGGRGEQISCIMEKMEVAYEYFFSCKSTNQNKTFIDLKITRKSIKPVK